MGRLFLILVVVVIGMALMGWLSFSSSSNSASITLDKTQMQKDTNDLKNKVQEATDQLSGQRHSEPAKRETIIVVPVPENGPVTDTQESTSIPATD